MRFIGAPPLGRIPGMTITLYPLIVTIQEYESKYQAFTCAYLRIYRILERLSVEYGDETATRLFRELCRINAQRSRTDERINLGIGHLKHIIADYEELCRQQQMLIDAIRAECPDPGNIFEL